MEPEEEPCGAAVREVFEEVSSSNLTKQKKKRLMVVHHITGVILCFLHFVSKTALKLPIKLLMSLVTIDVIHVKSL